MTTKGNLIPPGPSTSFEMQIHLIVVASKLRLRLLDKKPLELDLGVNLRNKNDFIMPSDIKVPADYCLRIT